MPLASPSDGRFRACTLPVPLALAVGTALEALPVPRRALPLTRSRVRFMIQNRAYDGSARARSLDSFRQSISRRGCLQNGGLVPGQGPVLSARCAAPSSFRHFSPPPRFARACRVLAQDMGDPFEVFVADSGTDGTADVVRREFPRSAC